LVPISKQHNNKTQALPPINKTKGAVMKFINYLEKITGVDIYALSSFSIFFTFFLIMTIWAWKADKKLIDQIRQIPLEN
jgi:hypothetical protein